jgi:PIN domain nuclease of toxin-antitoxin system
MILDKNLRKCVSISSLWEIAIKNRIGKLPLPYGINGIYSELHQNGIGVVGVYRSHVETYNTLPLIHRDPFDGIIVATAITENMIIVTSDEEVQKYEVSWIW